MVVQPSMLTFFVVYKSSILGQQNCRYATWKWWKGNACSSLYKLLLSLLNCDWMTTFAFIIWLIWKTVYFWRSSLFWKALKKLRNDIFAQKGFTFDAKFETDCQNAVVPRSFKQIICALLHGNTTSVNDAKQVQQCLTISLLILYNCKKQTANLETQWHSLEREPPFHFSLGWRRTQKHAAKNW